MEKTMEELRETVFANLDLSREMTDEEIHEIIDIELARYGKYHAISLREREKYSTELFNSLRKLDVLQQLVDDDSITEIMVNGTEHIFYEKAGELYQWDKKFATKEKLEDVIQQIVGGNNRVVNEASPIVDTRLKSGARVNVVLAPVSIDGPAISIRKFPETPITMDQLLELQSISEEIVQFLKLSVLAGYNIFISGGTGSGKTTFLNALSDFIPKEQRIITIEDSAELQIHGIANLVRLETRNANLESVKPISIRDLIRTALRMRPDRIIVGACRGEAALDMLQAMNTGHDGSISTGHANSCKDMVSRLETMVLMGMDLPLSAIRAQIASGIDILVHLGRLRDCSRRLLNIMEITGVENGEVVLNPIYRFKEAGSMEGRLTGCWERTGTLTNIEKMKAAGLEDELFKIHI